MDQVADLGTINVVGRRSGARNSSSSKNGTQHNYKIRVQILCSAADTFDMIKGAGMSAPGAPAAREGRTGGIRLYGNGGRNYITQVVNSRARTITNITEFSHQFYPGTVNISVVSGPNGTSFIGVYGTGVVDSPVLNNVLGYAFFGGVMAAGIERRCAEAANVMFAGSVP